MGLLLRDYFISLYPIAPFYDRDNGCFGKFGFIERNYGCLAIEINGCLLYSVGIIEIFLNGSRTTMCSGGLLYTPDAADDRISVDRCGPLSL